MASGSIEIGSSSRSLSTRILDLLSAILVLIAGLALRKLREELPQFLAEYAGDTLNQQFGKIKLPPYIKIHYN